MRRAYAEVPGMADYCVYWIKKAHDHLPTCTAADPVAGRAGLVGTQNIRNNQSRVGGLDYVVTTGTIVEAVENQPWSGEAVVHVSIANWVKTQDAALLPKKRKLWLKIEPSAGAKKLRKRGSGPACKEYELDVREFEHINSALTDKADVGTAKALACNEGPKRIFQGVTPGHKVQAFLFDDDYSYEILQSSAHWQWFLEKCSKLKSDFSYLIESVFDTFPWPQPATVKHIDAVSTAARELRRVRAEALPKIKGGLRALYRTLELPGANPLKDANAALDAAALAAYGFSDKKNLLAQFIALNQEVAAKIERGEPVTAPGVPPIYPDAKNLVTDDCIRPSS